MTTTKPRAEQVTFDSANTGKHTLDAYMEASERGGRTLPDMLQDIFDDQGKPIVGSGLYEYVGSWTASTPYKRGDTFNYNNDVFVTVEPHTSDATSPINDLNAFKIRRVLDGSSIISTATAARDAAQDAETLADSHKTNAFNYAQDAEAYRDTAFSHKNDAEAASTNTTSLFNTFQNSYYGEVFSEPTTRPDGSATQPGDLAFQLNRNGSGQHALILATGTTGSIVWQEVSTDFVSALNGGTFQGAVTVTATLTTTGLVQAPSFLAEDTAPSLELKDTDGAANYQRWTVENHAGTLYLRQRQGDDTVRVQHIFYSGGDYQAPGDIRFSAGQHPKNTGNPYCLTLDGVYADTNGNIDLVAGSGISITPSSTSSEITIEATGGGSSGGLDEQTTVGLAAFYGG